MYMTYGNVWRSLGSDEKVYIVEWAQGQHKNTLLDSDTQLEQW